MLAFSHGLGSWKLRTCSHGYLDEAKAAAVLVKLAIVKKIESLVESTVRAFCDAQLTGYKKPKIVEFRTELPKTAVGRVLRRELRAAA